MTSLVNTAQPFIEYGRLEPLIVSVAAATRVLGLSQATIHALLRAEEIEGVRVDGRIMIPMASMRAYVDRLPRYEPDALTEWQEVKPAPHDEPASKRILRAKEVCARTGLARATIYMRAAAGTFPNRISLGGRASGWREADIEAWMTNPAAYRASD